MTTTPEQRQAAALAEGRKAEAEGRPVIYIHGRPYADPGHDASAQQEPQADTSGRDRLRATVQGRRHVLPPAPKRPRTDRLDHTRHRLPQPQQRPAAPPRQAPSAPPGTRLGLSGLRPPPWTNRRRPRPAAGPPTRHRPRTAARSAPGPKRPRTDRLETAGRNAPPTAARSRSPRRPANAALRVDSRRGPRPTPANAGNPEALRPPAKRLDRLSLAQMQGRSAPNAAPCH